MRMPEVVDRILIDVSNSLTTLDLVTHGHYQVFDPVVDFEKNRFLLELFMHALSISLWNALSHVSLV